MGVPSFQQLMLPALQTIGQRYDEISISGLEDEVSRALKISVEERQLRLPSGNQTLFANRLNWARSYLSKAGLIELPRRGYCRATDRGRELLAQGVSEIDLGLLERYPEFVAWRSQSKGGDAEEIGSRDDAEESIARISSSSTPNWRATLSGACIRSAQPSSSASSSTSWCVWATAADGLRWAGRLAGLAMVA